MTLLIVVASYTAAFAIDTPHANVPFSASTIKLDGRIGSGEWKGAAIIRNIRTMGGKLLAAPATTFYLKHDGDSLLVAVRCIENAPGYPRAYPRRPIDCLSDDDAVQVVLGVADENIVSRDVINFGGYAGATDQAAAAADHYYQFTTNSAGAISRSYNETPLENLLSFKSTVSRLKGQWEVEMRIPFASAGIINPIGRTIFANLFRFRPPNMTGWYLPGFGGYVPMPFAGITLLPEGQETQPTIETLPPKVKQAITPVPSKVTGNINWYPLSRCIVGEVKTSGRPITGTAILRINNAERRLNLAKKGRTRVICDLPNDMPLPIEANLTVISNGKQLLHETKTITDLEQPTWIKSTAGSDYISNKVPAPWTAPAAIGSKVKLYNKTIEFSPTGLFKSVKDDNGELLYSPATISLTVNKRLVTLKPGRMSIKRLGNGALVESQMTFAGGTVETRTNVDYDGFCVIKLRVLGVKPQLINALSVNIPIKKDNAQFVHRELVQEIKEIQPTGWSGPAGPVWVGGHDRGISFNSDTDLFLSKTKRSQIVVGKRDICTWLHLNLVDSPAQIKDKSHIFRFFLQPTPTKRLSLRKESSFFSFVWENWSDYQGYPDLTKTAGLKAQADEAHKNNRLFGVYTCQLLAENSPDFSTQRNDLMALPPQVMYKRAYDPGKDIPCYLCCKRGPEGLLQLEGLEKLIKEAGIDGIYSDGMSLAWDCDNPSHKDGCGRPADIKWNSESLTRVTGQRQFLKRLRGIFSDRGKPFFMAAHCGGGLDINTLSFFDGYLEGEQLARFRPCYRIPLSTFTVGYCGSPWGFRTVFWDMFYSQVGGNRKATPGWALTYSLLHDTETEGATELERRIYKGFEDDKETKYYPYWRPQPYIKQINNKLLCSYYRKADSALLIFGNLTYNDLGTNPDISNLYPNQQVTATDLVTGEEHKVNQGRIALSVKSHRFCAIRIDTNIPVKTGVVTTTEAPAPPELNIKSLNPDQWELNPGAPGVTITPGADFGDGTVGLKLSTIIYQASAITKLKLPVGNNATIKLKIKRSGPRLKIAIGDAIMMFDWNWQVTALDLWNTGRMFQTTAPIDQTQILLLSLNDGILDATYGGQPLARDLKPLGITSSNTFELSTWGGDSFTYDVLEITSHPTKIYEEANKHPIL
jgi:hypothetical protein